MMNQIQSEYDRLLSRYGSPIKKPRPWKRISRPTPSTFIAKPAKILQGKNQSSAPASRE